MNIEKLSPAELVALCAKNEVEQLFGSGWRSVMLLRSVMQRSDIVSASWGGFRDRAGVEWPDFWRESTLEECVEWQYNPKDGQLRITMLESDLSGPVFGGDLRRWVFNVDPERHEKLFSMFLTALESQLKSKAYFEFERREEERRKAEIEKIYMSYVTAEVKDISSVRRRRKND